MKWVLSGMARYIYCFCLQCFDHLLCELAFFSCDGDATHKLQRQVDGWMATNTESGSNEQRKYCRKNPEEEAMVIKGIK